MHVQQCMTPDPVVVSEHEGLDRLAVTMHRLRIGRLPVVDESGRLIGIVSDGDVRAALDSARRTAGNARHERNVTARDVMTRDVVTVAPEVDLLRAVEILRQRRFGCLPVVEFGVVVGILTKHDLLRCLHEMLIDSSARQTQPPGVEAATSDGPWTATVGA